MDIWLEICIAVLSGVIAVIGYRLHVAEKKIETLIEAHNALAIDYASSLDIVKAFNKAVEKEQEG